MRHWGMWLCVALMAAAVVLVATGADVIVLVPALGCAVMMGMMVWMMVRGLGHHGNNR